MSITTTLGPNVGKPAGVLGFLRFRAAGRSTPRGPVSVSWEREGDALRVEVEIPPGTEAVLPGGGRLPAGRHAIAL